VDTLIRAFNAISARHPRVRLVVMGHCPDRTPYVELAGDNTNIEFYPGTPHPEAMKVMARCAVFVLPSRTDAMARVLIEAMALGKPVVASRVDGIPYYVKDGERGLLFTPGSVRELAHQLDRVLSDPALAALLGRNGHAFVNRELNEKAYVDTFRSMVERTIRSGEGLLKPVEPPLRDERPQQDRGGLDIRAGDS
jgi:glycosyltransferase involved in cell wall biosynthesis